MSDEASPTAPSPTAPSPAAPSPTAPRAPGPLAGLVRAGAPSASEPPAGESGAPAPPREPGLLGWWRRRVARTQARWEDVLHASPVARTRLIAKVVTIHVRYACGYLAAGYLVSAPIQLAFRREEQALSAIGHSLALGLLFALPFVLLIPLTKIDWARMRLPEFKNLELNLTWWATVGAGAMLALAWGLQVFDRGSVWARYVEPRVAWLNLVLMFLAWARVKFDTFLFRDFYALAPDDDTLVLLRSTRAPRPTEQEATAPPGPTPAAGTSPPDGAPEGPAPGAPPPP